MKRGDPLDRIISDLMAGMAPPSKGTASRRGRPKREVEMVGDWRVACYHRDKDGVLVRRLVLDQ